MRTAAMTAAALGACAIVAGCSAPAGQAPSPQVAPAVKLSPDPALDRALPTAEELSIMLGGDGFYRGSTILVTGSAGTGKTSVAAHFAAATAQRGERVLYLSFEESQSQIVRNLKSIGLDLAPLATRDLLKFRSVRGAHYGLEMHLATMYAMVDELEPSVVVLDPITALRAE